MSATQRSGRSSSAGTGEPGVAGHARRGGVHEAVGVGDRALEVVATATRSGAERRGQPLDAGRRPAGVHVEHADVPGARRSSA